MYLQHWLETKCIHYKAIRSISSAHPMSGSLYGCPLKEMTLAELLYYGMFLKHIKYKTIQEFNTLHAVRAVYESVKKNHGKEAAQIRSEENHY